MQHAAKRVPMNLRMSLRDHSSKMGRVLLMLQSCKKEEYQNAGLLLILIWKSILIRKSILNPRTVDQRR